MRSGAIVSIGGPALVYYVSPTDEELFKVPRSFSPQISSCLYVFWVTRWLIFVICVNKKFDPELQKRSLENREGRQEDFNKFVRNLKEYSRSDKPSKYFN